MVGEEEDESLADRTGGAQDTCRAVSNDLGKALTEQYVHTALFLWI